MTDKAEKVRVLSGCTSRISQKVRLISIGLGGSVDLDAALGLQSILDDCEHVNEVAKELLEEFKKEHKIG